MNDLTKEELNYDERMYLQRLFFDHHEKIDKKLHEELLILSKYKAELSKKYEQCGSYQNTLIDCMKSILDKQDELFWIAAHLIKAITGKYPEHEDHINAVEDRNPWK